MDVTERGPTAVDTGSVSVTRIATGNQSGLVSRKRRGIVSIHMLFLSDKQKCPRDKKTSSKKVQAGKDQEKAQSEKDSHSKNRGGKKPN